MANETSWINNTNYFKWTSLQEQVIFQIMRIIADLGCGEAFIHKAFEIENGF